MPVYDKYYQTPNLFGVPYPELLRFFVSYAPKGKVLDMGCGQGRDALALARIGYSVIGLDNSRQGIMQMIQEAEARNLSVEAKVADIYQFEDYAAYDVVLLDSMFHFDKKGIKKEKGLLERIAREIRPGALICICIQDTGAKVNILKQTLSDTDITWEALEDVSLQYQLLDQSSGHKSTTPYRMYIVKKSVQEAA